MITPPARPNLARPSLDRRRLLKGAAGAGLVMMPFVRSTPLFAQLRDDPFTLGIASGEPAPDGFVLWTGRATEPLTPRGGMAPVAMEVTWEVATDEAMRQVVQSGTTLAWPEVAHSVHVEVAGLEPARDYFYRFRAGG